MVNDISIVIGSKDAISYFMKETVRIFSFKVLHLLAAQRSTLQPTTASRLTCVIREEGTRPYLRGGL